MPSILKSIMILVVYVSPTIRRDVEPERAFEGTWELVELSKNGKAVSRESDSIWRDPLEVREGRWTQGEDERRRPKVTWNVTRTDGDHWPRVERTRTIHMGISNVMIGQRGIYRLHGDTLTFAFRSPTNPPDDFEPGEGKTIEAWHRIKR